MSELVRRHPSELKWKLNVTDNNTALNRYQNAQNIKQNSHITVLF